MKLSEAISKQIRKRGNLKLRAAQMIAGIMMAHYIGPFEDSQFYAEDEDQEAAVYFNEHGYKDLYDDPEFRKMVVNAVAEKLGVTLRR